MNERERTELVELRRQLRQTIREIDARPASEMTEAAYKHRFAAQEAIYLISAALTDDAAQPPPNGGPFRGIEVPTHTQRGGPQ